MKTFYEAIYEWAKASGVESVGIDWTSLADHLNNTDIKPDELNAYTKSSVYSALDQHYVEEDVEEYANDHGYKLTEQQVGYVADRIRNSDWYCSISAEDIKWYINQELKEGE